MRIRATLFILAVSAWCSTVATARADEWQPTLRPVAVPAASTPVNGITLGLPQGARVAATETSAVQPASQPVRTTSLFTPPEGKLTGWNTNSTRTTFRGQIPGDPYAPPPGYGGPVGPEEGYNCGVVSEGPAAGGHPLKGFWDKIFGGCGTGAPGPLAGKGSWQSDHCFDGFISPMTNPYFFEDPRALTEVRTVFNFQKAPGGNSLLRGGHVFDFGLQGRIAFDDRWSLVIHRLGIANVSPGSGATDNGLPFSGGTGLTDLQLGPKFTFFRDDRTNTLAAVGLNFELPIGSESALSGVGSGAVTPYITAAQAFGNWHFMGAFGYRFAFDSERTDSLFTSLHVDYSFFNRFYPFAELNWYHYVSNGHHRSANFEGADLFNLGSDSVSGNNTVTLGLGARYKFTESIQAGVVYELPVMGKDLMSYRLGFDLIFRY